MGNASEVVERIHRRLEGAHSCSFRNGISFRFKKFHLINVGRKKLPGVWKKRVCHCGA